jgi:hypothetical protein
VRLILRSKGSSGTIKLNGCGNWRFRQYSSSYIKKKSHAFNQSDKRNIYSHIINTVIVCKTLIYCKQSKSKGSLCTVSLWELLRNTYFYSRANRHPALVPQANKYKTTPLLPLSLRAFCHTWVPNSGPS